jgi:hypothetical protein
LNESKEIKDDVMNYGSKENGRWKWQSHVKERKRSRKREIAMSVSISRVTKGIFVLSRSNLHSQHYTQPTHQ